MGFVDVEDVVGNVGIGVSGASVEKVGAAVEGEVVSRGP